jgi:hypothetical protein
VRTRLVLAGLDMTDRQRALLLPVLNVIARQQGIEATPESLQFHGRAPGAAVAAAVTYGLPAQRSRISCASRRYACAPFELRSKAITGLP